MSRVWAAWATPTPGPDDVVAVGLPGIWRGEGPTPKLVIRERHRHAGSEARAIECNGVRVERLQADPVRGTPIEPLGDFIHRAAEVLGVGEPLVLMP